MLLQPSRTKRLRRRTSKLRPVLFKTVGVIAVLVLVELAARGCIGAVVSRSIDGNTVGVSSVNVATGDVPVVYHYWLFGDLRNGSITMHDVVATPVNISTLSVTAEKLEFSRTELITGRAKLTGSPPYRTTVILSPKNLGDHLNSTVHFQTNHLVATIEGHNMNVVPRLDGRKIVLADERYTYDVPLPGKAYLPCEPDSIGVGNGIAVSCSSDTLPPFVARATK